MAEDLRQGLPEEPEEETSGLTIDDFLKYLMHTPQNTNPNVVKDMIKQIGSGGSGGVAIFDMVEIGDGIKAIQCSAKELWDAYQTQTVLIRWAYTANNHGHPIQYSWIYQLIFAQLKVEDSGKKSYWFQTNKGTEMDFHAENDSDNPTSE